jgi:hypothetical protein
MPIASQAMVAAVHMEPGILLLLTERACHRRRGVDETASAFFSVQSGA